jgi:hypothetical protein
LKDDWATAEAQLADDIEWHMMPNNQTRKGKADVFSFLKASKYASQKEPIPISNRADKEWGVGSIGTSALSSGKLVMETILETKASSILQFIHGLRGGTTEHDN